MTDEIKIVISGKVTDFDNNPLRDALVEIKNDQFKAIYKTSTNENGEYKIHVEKGLYLALMACKDYKTKYLEYWAWNVPANQDLQFNPRIGGTEVYAINAFMPQGAYPSLMIYFRPMSLKRSHAMESAKASKKTSAIDISPALSTGDIELKIDGKPVKILELNRVEEYAGGLTSMIAYLIQSTLPKKSIIAYLVQAVLPIKIHGNKKDPEYLRIDIALRDAQTGERGEGCLFWKRPQTEATA
jgi:hypothetical protein